MSDDGDVVDDVRYFSASDGNDVGTTTLTHWSLTIYDRADRIIRAPLNTDKMAYESETSVRTCTLKLKLRRWLS